MTVVFMTVGRFYLVDVLGNIAMVAGVSANRHQHMMIDDDDADCYEYI